MPETNYGGSTATMANWGGYLYCPPPADSCSATENPNASGSHAVTLVQAVWQVPIVTCTGACSNEAVSTWIGVGGVGTTDLMQAGIEEDWQGSGGSFETYAWWTENTYPNNMGITVHPGDWVVGEVWFDGWLHNGMQNWGFYIYDQTNGQNFMHGYDCGVGTNCSAASGFESADFIMESPAGSSGYAQLPAYSTVPFTYLQYESGSSTNYLGSTSSANVVRVEQDYLAQALLCPQVPFCQLGVIPSQIFGTSNASKFYPQYLVDTLDAPLKCCSVSPTSGTPGTKVTGTADISNPSGYSIQKGVNYGTGGLSAIDLGLEMGLVQAGGASSSSVSVQSTPYWGVYDWLNGYVYVANEGTDTVSVIHGGSVIATITVGGDPLMPAVSPISGMVFVPNSAGNTVSVILGTSLYAAKPSITVGGNPHSVVVNPSNYELYVANWGSNNVSVLQGASVSSSISVGSDPLFAVGGGSYVYVDDSGSSTVSVITTATGAVTNVSVGAHPMEPVYDPSNGYAYVSNSGGSTVSVLQGTSLVGTVSVGSSPEFAAYDPQNGYVYVPNNLGGSVTVLSGTSVVSGGTVVVGTGPVVAQFDPFDSEIYVTNNGSGNVSVLGGSGGTTVVGSIGVGSVPRGITFSPANDELFVMNSGGGTVTILNPAGAPSCFDTTNAPTVNSGLTWAGFASSAKSALSICSGLPNGIYLFEFLLWWVPVGQLVASSGSELLVTTVWSYAWGGYFTIT